MAQKRVLLIGLDPALVDFSHTPDWSADEVRTAAGAAVERLRVAGYEVVECLIDLGETAEHVVLQALAQMTYDCVMFGAGLRGLPEHTLLFERIINLVHEHAPSAKLCFNTHPSNTFDAVRRWV